MASDEHSPFVMTPLPWAIKEVARGFVALFSTANGEQVSCSIYDLRDALNAAEDMAQAMDVLLAETATDANDAMPDIRAAREQARAALTAFRAIVPEKGRWI